MSYGGKSPGGMCPGGKYPGVLCPWGKCSGGTCPGGFCPRTAKSITSSAPIYSCLHLKELLTLEKYNK